jgi:hypothetical protein
VGATVLPPAVAGPRGQRPPFTLVAIGLIAALILVLAAAFAGPKAIAGVGLIDLVLLGVATHQFVLRWHNLAVAIVLCILLIPIGRYEFPVTLPFNMEPYRALVMLVALLWAASLLGQPNTRWRKTGIFMPLAAVLMSVIVSIGVNNSRLDLPGVHTYAIKQLSMLLSFIIVLLFVTAVIVTRDHLHVMVKALVGGGGVVSFFALIQYRAGFNLFDHLHTIFPVLRLVPGGIPSHIESRGGGDARIYASAEHPIALSVALVMLLPLGVYLAKAFPGRRRWPACTALIAIAALATVSRTGSLMLVVEILTFLCLKPRQVLRLWPWLLPFLAVVHIAAPGAFGGLKSAFFPKQGLVAEQTGVAGSNRLSSASPALKEWAHTPVFGQGYGTRITAPTDPHRNAFILDDQWLGTLLETGAIGTVSILWLFVGTIRRTGAASRRDPTTYGWLLAAITAAIASFAVGMLTFDAFSFTQCTFIMFMFIGLAVVARRLAVVPAAPPE